jgi:hypothetical protein
MPLRWAPRPNPSAWPIGLLGQIEKHRDELFALAIEESRLASAPCHSRRPGCSDEMSIVAPWRQIVVRNRRDSEGEISHHGKDTSPPSSESAHADPRICVLRNHYHSGLDCLFTASDIRLASSWPWTVRTLPLDSSWVNVEDRLGPEICLPVADGQPSRARQSNGWLAPQTWRRWVQVRFRRNSAPQSGPSRVGLPQQQKKQEAGRAHAPVIILHTAHASVRRAFGFRTRYPGTGGATLDRS